MTSNAMVRASAAAEKRQQRQAHERLRDLERRAKEQVKLSALEQARLEVDTHEGQLDVLLSIHKEQSDPSDWNAVAASLPPVEPQKQQHRELRGRQIEILASAGFGSFLQRGRAGAATEGRSRDEQEFQDALKAYSEQRAEWEMKTALARRILVGDQAAFTEVLTEMNPLADISDLCVAAHFTVRNSRLVECVLRVKGTDIIPTEAKTLTANGKLSVKAMPKTRLHNIFQDYVCGCVLRVAREVFAILPLEVVLLTASIDALDASPGGQCPVLSVVIPRAVLNGLDWDRIDPSDAMDSFVHSGDVKASRKTGEFIAIAPLTVQDVVLQSADTAVLAETLAHARRMRQELLTESAALARLGSVEVPQD